MDKKTCIDNKKRIWTLGYFPFTMGGNVNRSICTDVEIKEEEKLGKGIVGWLVDTPRGERVCEATTGAIVGNSFEKVKQNIADATQDMVDKQIADAKELARKAEHFEPGDFWRMYNTFFEISAGIKTFNYGKIYE